MQNARDVGYRHVDTAQVYGNVAQVALRWLIQQDGVVAIPKATGRDHLAENVEVVDFSLTEGEMARVHDLHPSLGMHVKNALPSIMRSLPFTPPA